MAKKRKAQFMEWSDVGHAIAQASPAIGAALSVGAAWLLDELRERRKQRHERAAAARQLEEAREDLVVSLTKNLETNLALFRQLQAGNLGHDGAQIYANLFSEAAWAAHGPTFMRLCNSGEERLHFAEFFENVGRFIGLAATDRQLKSAPRPRATGIERRIAVMLHRPPGITNHEFEGTILEINNHGTWILSRYGKEADRVRLGIPRTAATTSPPSDDAIGVAVPATS